MNRLQNRADPLRVASRKDLLLVCGDSPEAPSNPEATLISLGFRVRRTHLHHWVVTGERSLPELHFYSKMELGRFVMDRAGRYLKPCQRSVRYVDVADLPG